MLSSCFVSSTLYSKLHKIKEQWEDVSLCPYIYRVSIKPFPNYKHLLQENYMEYKYVFIPLLKLVS
jgi:hypothetical protein